MIHLKLPSLVALLFCVLLISCEADIQLTKISNNISIDPSLVMPLGGLSLNLGDIITANDSNKVISSNYSELTYERIDSMLFTYPMPDLVANAETYNKSLCLSPIAITVPANYKIPTVTFDQDFDLGVNDVVAKEQVDSIKIAKAVLTIVVRANGLAINPSNLKFTLTFGNGKMRMLDKSPSVFTFTPKGFDLPQLITISDFVIITSGKANSIPLQISLDATTSGPLSLTPNSKIDMEFKFTTLDWKAMYGKFDLASLSDFITTTQHLQVNLKKYLPNGEVKLTNPQIAISANSNVGMKLGFKLDYFKSYTCCGDTVYANFNGKQNLGVEFNSRPILPGKSVDFAFQTFDKNYGQIDKLIEKRPEFFDFKITAFSNQSDPLSNYITPDSRINVKLKTTIPLQLNAGSYYEHTDTMTNVFGDLARQFKQTVLDKVEMASLVFTIDNKLPVKSLLFIRFLDGMGKEVMLSTTFKKTYEVDAAKVNAEGKVMDIKSTQQLIISLTNEELNMLKKAISLEFKIRVEGADFNSKIFFSNTNTFDIKVGMFLKTKLN